MFRADHSGSHRTIGAVPVGDDGAVSMPAPDLTTYVQTASWAAAAVTGVIGVWKFGQDNRKDRTQRASKIAAREEATRVAERELEWRRATGAQLVLEKMEEDELAAHARLGRARLW
jgi:hypothetical protein